MSEPKITYPRLTVPKRYPSQDPGYSSPVFNCLAQVSRFGTLVRFISAGGTFFPYTGCAPSLSGILLHCRVLLRWINIEMFYQLYLPLVFPSRFMMVPSLELFYVSRIFVKPLSIHPRCMVTGCPRSLLYTPPTYPFALPPSSLIFILPLRRTLH